MDDPLKSIRRAVPAAPDQGFPTTQQLLGTYVLVKGKGRGELFARTANMVFADFRSNLRHCYLVIHVNLNALE